MSNPPKTRSHQIPRWFELCVVVAYLHFLAGSAYLLFWQRDAAASGAFGLLALLAILAPYLTGVHARFSTSAGDAGLGVGVKAPAATMDDPTVSEEPATADERAQSRSA